MPANISQWKQRQERIRDPVYGLVQFGGSHDDFQNETDLIAWSLIGTPEFQRLRRIKQLGVADQVFPGATHTRFSHSIGVYYTARQLVNVLERNLGSEFNRERARSTQLAALLHDIGHGPYSHAFEGITSSLGHHKKHEDWTREIVLGSTGIGTVLREIDELLANDVVAILDHAPADVYSGIVSGQFDADRLEYIQRDAQMTGVAFGQIDRDWLLDSLRVTQIKNDRGEQQQCFYLTRKGLDVGVDYIQARTRLFEKVYLHKTSRAIELMYRHFIESVIGLSSDGTDFDHDRLVMFLQSSDPDLRSYLALDDSCFTHTLTVFADHSEAYTAGLARRILARDTYGSVHVTRVEGTSEHVRYGVEARLRTKASAFSGRWWVETDRIPAYDLTNPNTDLQESIMVEKEGSPHHLSSLADASSIVKGLAGDSHLIRVFVEDKQDLELVNPMIRDYQRNESS